MSISPVGEWVLSIYVSDNKVKLVTAIVDISQNNVIECHEYLADKGTIDNILTMNKRYEVGILSKDIFLTFNNLTPVVSIQS